MPAANPTPAEVQASLDATLAAYVDQQPTPEARAGTLIKIGVYSTELSKYAPMLEDADPDFIDEVIGEWVASGDGELRKMVFNAFNGADNMELAKAAPEEGAEYELAKMVNEAPEGSSRMAMLQKIGAYTVEFRNVLEHAAAGPDDKAEEIINAWIESGDGSHKAMKKAVSADALARATAAAGVGERDVVDQVIGNASTHAGSKLGDSSGSPDQGIRRTIPKRPAAPGAGARPRGALVMPNQADAPEVNAGSGPNDTGDGGVSPSSKIKRKGSTGGLGSVRGAQKGADSSLASAGDHVGGQNLVRQDVTKADLAVELLKIAPDEMLDAVEALDEDEQVAVCEEAATHAADLMAWSDQIGESLEKRSLDALEKRSLDAAVEQWLLEDPDTIQLKKWTAEALATAEEIPLELGIEIMAWTPEGPLNKQEIADYIEEMQKINWGQAAGKLGGALRGIATRATGAGKAAGAALGRAAGSNFVREGSHVAGSLKQAAGRGLRSGLGVAARNPGKAMAGAGAVGYFAGRSRRSQPAA